MTFRLIILVVALGAATPMNAQLVEDISLRNAEGNSIPDAKGNLLTWLYLLEPEDVVRLYWIGGTSDLETVSSFINRLMEPQLPELPVLVSVEGK